MYDAGFDAVAIDWEANKHLKKFSTLELNLTKHQDQQVFWRMVQVLKPKAVHLGVARGTSSRARKKEIPKSLRLQGAPRPVPLRSADYPGGLPGLSPANSERVRLVNISRRSDLGSHQQCFHFGGKPLAIASLDVPGSSISDLILLPQPEQFAPH